MVTARLLQDREVPLISFSALIGSVESRAAAVDKVRSSLDEVGFLVLDHDSMELHRLGSCFGLARQLFSLPNATKETLDHRRIDQRRYGNIGYYPFQTETAVGSRSPDPKEFFHVGVGDFVGAEMDECYPKNTWPDELPGFRNDISGLFYDLFRGAMAVLDAVGNAYGCETEYLHDLVHDGNSILRIIHYPPSPAAVPRAEMRAAPHTGINMLGLQPPSTSRGLQFCTPRGEWVALREMAPSWVSVNVGEMFSHVLAQRAAPTLHRVVCPDGDSENDDRYTIVYFFHANPLRTLVPVGSEGGGDCKPVQVGDWLMDRLAAIGMK